MHPSSVLRVCLHGFRAAVLQMRRVLVELRGKQIFPGTHFTTVLCLGWFYGYEWLPAAV